MFATKTIVTLLSAIAVAVSAAPAPADSIDYYAATVKPSSELEARQRLPNEIVYLADCTFPGGPGANGRNWVQAVRLELFCIILPR
jgi:hypothetical protein